MHTLVSRISNRRFWTVFAPPLTGKSGRAILAALIAGESDPDKLAELAQGNARKKRAGLVEALRGRVRPHHRELLRIHLNLIQALTKRSPRWTRVWEKPWRRSNAAPAF
jgi:hypothetical protein